MAFERLKNFIAPPENEDGYDEPETNEVQEITYRESEVKPVSTYESKRPMSERFRTMRRWFCLNREASRKPKRSPYI